MANPIDYSKLSDDTLEKMSSGHPLDYSTLPDTDLEEMVKASATPKEAPKMSAMSAAGQGVRNLGGAGPIAAGAAQAIPDKIQAMLHSLAPSLVGKSPTQVNAALAAMGVKGNIGPTDSSQLYNEAKLPEEQALEEASKQHPWATMGGKLGGDLLAFEGLGAIAPKLMEAGEGAGRLKKIGTNIANSFIPAAEIGAMESKHKLIGGNPTEAMGVAKDAASSGAKGSLLVGGLSALANGLGAGAESASQAKPVQELKTAFQLGREGKNLSSETSQLGSLNEPDSLTNAVSLEDTKAATGVFEQINTIDEHLGKEVGSAIEGATSRGEIIKPKPDIASKIQSVFSKTPQYLQEGEEAAEGFDQGSLKRFYGLAQKYQESGLSPAEMQEFRNGLGDLQRKISFNDPYLSADVRGLVTDITGQMKSTISGYADAANRLDQFRRSVPETILSKDNPQDITNLRMSRVRNVDTKLVDQLKRMIRGLHSPTDTTVRGAYTNLLQGLQAFKVSELAKQAEAIKLQRPFKSAFEATGITPEGIESSLKTAAMRSKVIQDVNGLKPADLEDVYKRPLGLAKRYSNQIANTIGGYSNPVIDASRKLYNASNESLTALADKFEGIPAHRAMATALKKAIESKNETQKNAILFSIMQNPASRRIIDSGEFDVGSGF